jgi:dsRNA-specific ribonuclease
MTGNADPTDLSKGLGYEFKDPELLAEAFRHSSYVNESENAGLKDNERLEFLGDAVLDLAISDILMGFFQNAKEGELSKCRASVVNEKVLSHLARELRVGAYLLLGKGEELSGGREKPSILANTLEALLGRFIWTRTFQRQGKSSIAFFCRSWESWMSKALPTITKACFKNTRRINSSQGLSTPLSARPDPPTKRHSA